jgi:hypothetical protein
MALAMYRRKLTDSEKNSVQTYLLKRYNQLCPAFPQMPATTNGCPATAAGDRCTISCFTATTPATARIGGDETIFCVNGAWRGRMPVCGVQCAARASPVGAETCTLRTTHADFRSSSEYPVNTATAYSNMRMLSACSDTPWQSCSTLPTSVKMLIGQPTAPTGCNPQATGPLQLM